MILLPLEVRCSFVPQIAHSSAKDSLSVKSNHPDNTDRNRVLGRWHFRHKVVQRGLLKAEVRSFGLHGLRTISKRLIEISSDYGSDSRSGSYGPLGYDVVQSKTCVASIASAPYLYTCYNKHRSRRCQPFHRKTRMALFP